MVESVGVGNKVWDTMNVIHLYKVENRVEQRRNYSRTLYDWGNREVKIAPCAHTPSLRDGGRNIWGYTTIQSILCTPYCIKG